ncbi:MAG: hypothetical protein ABWZ98_07060 [Nakamurella sp.]
MSINWGPAMDAEIAYRHEQIHSDFRRPWRLFGRGRAATPATSVPGPVVAPVATLAIAPQSDGHRPAEAGLESTHPGQHVRAA